MPWFKVDDTFAEHPKLERLEASEPIRYMAAVCVWTVMGADCMRRLTNGYVSKTRLEKLLGHLGKHLKTASEALVDIGLWVRVDGGFQFHDWLDWQRSKDQVLKARNAKTERQKRYRDGLVDASTDVPRVARVDASTDRPTQASRDACPIPSPIPSPIPPVGPPVSVSRSEPTAAANAEWDAVLGTVCAERKRAKPVVTPSQSWQIAGRVRDLAATHGVSFRDAARKLAEVGLSAPAGKFAWVCLEVDPYVPDRDVRRAGFLAPAPSGTYGKPTNLDELYGPEHPARDGTGGE